jgi:hypothetical protein
LTAQPKAYFAIQYEYGAQFQDFLFVKKKEKRRVHRNKMENLFNKFDFDVP